VSRNEWGRHHSKPDDPAPETGNAAAARQTVNAVIAARAACRLVFEAFGVGEGDEELIEQTLEFVAARGAFVNAFSEGRKIVHGWREGLPLGL
jgi:hypothetical protein